MLHRLSKFLEICLGTLEFHLLFHTEQLISLTNNKYIVAERYENFDCCVDLGARTAYGYTWKHRHKNQC